MVELDTALELDDRIAKLESQLETARQINQYQRGRITALEAELSDAVATVEAYRLQTLLMNELAAQRSALIEELLRRIPEPLEDAV